LKTTKQGGKTLRVNNSLNKVVFKSNAKTNINEWKDEVISKVSQALIPLSKSVVKYCYGFGSIKYEHDLNGEKSKYWIPTVLNMEASDYEYHQVIVKVVSELDRETFEDEADRIFKQDSDLRKSNSITIFIVAPKCSKLHWYRLKKFGRKANIKKKDYSLGGKKRIFAIPIIAKKPETAVKVIIQILSKFYYARLVKFAETIGITPYYFDYNPRKLFSMIKDSVIEIENSFHRKTLMYMSKLTHTLREKLQEIIQDNIMQAKIRYELEELGIPANKYYWKFKQVVNEIIRLAKECKETTKVIKIYNKLKRESKETYSYGLKVIQWLKEGKYTIAS
jgi:hypothetical protein